MLTTACFGYAPTFPLPAVGPQVSANLLTGVAQPNHHTGLPLPDAVVTGGAQDPLQLVNNVFNSAANPQATYAIYFAPVAAPGTKVADGTNVRGVVQSTLHPAPTMRVAYNGGMLVPAKYCDAVVKRLPAPALNGELYLTLAPLRAALPVGSLNIMPINLATGLFPVGGSGKLISYEHGAEMVRVTFPPPGQPPPCTAPCNQALFLGSYLLFCDGPWRIMSSQAPLPPVQRQRLEFNVASFAIMAINMVCQGPYGNGWLNAAGAGGGPSLATLRVNLHAWLPILQLPPLPMLPPPAAAPILPTLQLVVDGLSALPPMTHNKPLALRVLRAIEAFLTVAPNAPDLYLRSRAQSYCAYVYYGLGSEMLNNPVLGARPLPNAGRTSPVDNCSGLKYNMVAYNWAATLMAMWWHLDR